MTQEFIENLQAFILIFWLGGMTSAMFFHLLYKFKKMESERHITGWFIVINFAIAIIFLIVVVLLLL